ncbi:putative Fe-containing alcohol dehydrogenase [Xylariales sp. AK1849]|nr:putative Fe-containing alcohol dehydrogenase [Xylariales sp. AK1849]
MPETFRPAFPGRSNPAISYGIPFTSSLIKHAEDDLQASRIYLICSSSLSRNTDYLSDLQSKLGPKLAGVHIGMKPHTHWSEILEIVSDARSCNADLLVTLGAGSLTDAAKVISFALANGVSTPEGLESLCPTSPRKRQGIKPSQIAVVCIPTSLSGGEYSATAGATNDESGRKYSFSGNGLAGPSLVILDPQLSASTPEHVWISTGVKAVDHCVETLCSLKSDEEADGEAKKGLEKLIPGLLLCKQNPRDLEARLQCQLGVIDAMSACSRGVPLGASHGIGHQLGPAGVGHGETSCVLLPAVCKYNYEQGANRERQEAIVDLLWKDQKAIALFEESDLGKEADLGDLLDAIIRALGMPRTLKEFDIGKDDFDLIAEHSLQDRWVMTNPASLNKVGVLEILNMILA